MNDETPMNDDQALDDLGKLIRLTGGREPIAEARFDAAHERVSAHWQTLVTERRHRRRSIRLGSFALAAVLVAAVSIAIFAGTRTPTPAVNVATVDHVVGDVFADGRTLRSGDTVARASVIETSASARIAIELSDGQSLRLDSATRVAIPEPDRIDLQQGAVYVASAAVGDPSPIYVETVFGVASDIGTRFQVRIDERQMSIGVRDGIVQVDNEINDSVSIRGGHLYLLASNGEGHERLLDENAPDWDWADSVRPPFDMDGATLMDYLEWYAREEGLRLQFADDRSEKAARAARLSGSIEGLSLEDGFALVRRIAPFSVASEEQIMTVSIE